MPEGTPTVEATPAAASAPSVSVTPSATPSAAAASAAPSTSSSPSTSFDWNKWDGKDDASIPETYRPAVSAMRERFKPDLEELANLRTWYETFATDEDAEPIVADLRGQVEAKAKDVEKLTKDLEAATKRHADLEAAIEAETERVAKEEVEAFTTKHAEILKHPKVQSYLMTMISKLDADPEIAIEALKLGKAGAQAYVDMRRKGANDAVAIEHARLVATREAPASAPTGVEPRGAARLVNGADAHTQRGAPIVEKDVKPTSLTAWRERAVEKAFKKNNLAG